MNKTKDSVYFEKDYSFTYIVQNMFLYVNMILTRKKDKLEGKNKREGVQGGADCQSQYYQKGLKIWII